MVKKINKKESAIPDKTHLQRRVLKNGCEPVCCNTSDLRLFAIPCAFEAAVTRLFARLYQWLWIPHHQDKPIAPTAPILLPVNGHLLQWLPTILQIDWVAAHRSLQENPNLLLVGFGGAPA